MILLEMHKPISTLIFLYVPLGGGLPAAAGLIGPILAFLFAILTGTLVFFRRTLGSLGRLLIRHWRWTTVLVGIIAIAGGSVALWYRG